jgi:prophage regulatory protein
MTTEDSTPDRIVREAECQRLTGLSRTQRWRLERAGRFPQRLQLSERAIGWLEREVRDWIAERTKGGKDRPLWLGAKDDKPPAPIAA